MEAHVICCNDSIEEVSLGKLVDAENRLKFLKEKFFQKRCVPEEKKEIYFWHVHTVSCYDREEKGNK